MKRVAIYLSSADLELLQRLVLNANQVVVPGLSRSAYVRQLVRAAGQELQPSDNSVDGLEAPRPTAVDPPDARQKQLLFEHTGRMTVPRGVTRGVQTSPFDVQEGEEEAVGR